MITEDEHRAQLQTIKKAGFATRIDDLNALREVFGEQVEEIVKANRAKKIEASWRKVADAHGRNHIQGDKCVKV